MINLQRKTISFWCYFRVQVLFTCPVNLLWLGYNATIIHVSVLMLPTSIFLHFRCVNFHFWSNKYLGKNQDSAFTSQRKLANGKKPKLSESTIIFWAVRLEATKTMLFSTWSLFKKFLLSFSQFVWDYSTSLFPILFSLITLVICSFGIQTCIQRNLARPGTTTMPFNKGSVFRTWRRLPSVSLITNITSVVLSLWLDSIFVFYFYALSKAVSFGSQLFISVGAKGDNSIGSRQFWPLKNPTLLFITHCKQKLWL